MTDIKRFKELVRALNPMRPVQGMTQADWYVERPDSLATRVARSFHLEPAASHLIIGSIGCGKSTELRAIERELNATKGFYADFAEISQVGHLDDGDQWEQLLLNLASNVVFALIGMGVEEESSEISSLIAEMQACLDDPAVQSMAEWADGRTVSPLVRRRSRGLDSKTTQYIALLDSVRRRIKTQQGGNLIVLVDGLDRLDDPAAFDALVGPVVGLFHRAQIGLVVVAPRKVVVGMDLLGTASVFGDLHAVSPIDPAPDSSGWKFLHDVLHRRDKPELLSTEARHDLIASSGGVMRILLQLTRQSVKDAYARRDDLVDRKHVVVAVERLGHSMLLGLDDADLQLLDQVGRDGVFAARNDRAWALVRANKILEYTGASGLRRYCVHPALEPFLPALSEQFELERRRRGYGAGLADDDIPF